MEDNTDTYYNYLKQQHCLATHMEPDSEYTPEIIKKVYEQSNSSSFNTKR